MKNNRKIRNRMTKHPMLSSVGTAVLATLIASGAHAADTSVGDNSAPPAANGHEVVNSVQSNPSFISATINGAAGTITNSDTENGSVNNSSTSVTTNTIAAKGVGNSFANSLDLGLINGPIGNATGDGEASLGAATNTGAVFSTVSSNSLGIALNGFSTGSAVNSDNTISASTTLNAGSSSIVGKIPNAYVSGTPGTITATYTAAEGGNSSSQATGTVASTSLQQSSATAGASGALASGNNVSIALTSSADNTVVSSPALENNEISATFKSNAATSQVAIGIAPATDGSAGAPAFNGSAVVTNLQLNRGNLVAADGSAANNTGSTITGSVSGTGGAVNTLQGTLSVQGNGIASNATGNESIGATSASAGNQILIGDGVSVAGTGGTPVNQVSNVGGQQDTAVHADLAIFNGQSNDGTPIASQTTGAQIFGSAQALQGGSITLGSNTISASAKGNNASSAIASGADSAAFNASVALASQQSNANASNVSAGIIGSGVVAFSGQDNGTTANATVAVSGNASSATAFGNQVSQSIALAATDLGLAGANGTVLTTGGSAGQVSASGAATITNLQANPGSSVAATNAGSVIGVVADSGGALGNTIDSSTLTVTGNTQESVGVANSGSNALSLNGNSVGSGAGINSLQTGAGNSVTSTLADSTASVFAGTHVDGSTLTLGNNLQRAIGYGSTVSNTLSVTADNVTPQVQAGPLAVGPTATSSAGLLNSTVGAAYGIANTQSGNGTSVASTVDGGGVDGVPALGIYVEGRVANSTLANTGNTMVAAGFGNDASNALTLASTQIGGQEEGGYSSVAGVANTQALVGGTVSAQASGGNVVLTHVEDNVSNSSLSTTGNTIQALAVGNQAGSNQITVTGNAINTAAAAGMGVGSAVFSGTGTQTAAASFAVQNTQSAQGSNVTASQVDGDAAAGIRTEIGTTAAGSGSVTNSNVALTGNQSTASATANLANNGISVAANSIATTTAVQNSQNSSSNVNSVIGTAGSPGSPAVPAAPFSFVVSGSGLAGTQDVENDVYNVTAGQFSTDVSGLSAMQIAYLANHGWTPSTGTTYVKSAVGQTVSTDRYSQLSEGATTAFNGTTGGTAAVAATPNGGGVTLAVAGTAITGSQLSVNGNSNAGSSIANSATNKLSVSGTQVAAGSGVAGASSSNLGGSVTTQADNTLANNQNAIGAPVNSQVFGTFAIDTAPGAAVSNSTLSVSNNSQSANANANTAQNTVAVSGTNVAASSVLNSTQSGSASVSASSNMMAYAPAAVNNSSVSFTGNSNTALAVMNDVTNTQTVSGSNIASTGAGVASIGNNAETGATATADHVLANQQTANSSVTSTATTDLYNQDRTAANTTGLSGSTLSISGNTTQVEATANRASNSLALNGTASQGASGAVSNVQNNAAFVTASATTNADVGLNGMAGFAALNQGSVSLDGNTTAALARGNSANNSLTATAGSNYGAPVGGASAGFNDGSMAVNATFAVLNNQSNSAPVSASAGSVGGVGGSSYTVAMNTLGGASVANSSVGVTGNTVAAQAFGNSATNTLSLTALGTGTPSAVVGNQQVNNAPVTAVAYGTNFGISATGAVSGSTMRVGGNQITATAVGNSAVSSITAAR